MISGLIGGGVPDFRLDSGLVGFYGLVVLISDFSLDSG